VLRPDWQQCQLGPGSASWRDTLRDPGEVGVVAYVAKFVLPDNGVTLYQEKPWHGPQVTDRYTGEVAFERCSYAACQGRGTEKFLHATALDPERTVETPVRIGDCTSLRPKPAKELCPICNGPLIEKENRGIGRLGSHDLAQVSDGLATEGSPEVTQKDQ